VRGRSDLSARSPYSQWPVERAEDEADHAYGESDQKHDVLDYVDGAGRGCLHPWSPEWVARGGGKLRNRSDGSCSEACARDERSYVVGQV
jgi:hypothetical protein